MRQEDRILKKSLNEISPSFCIAKWMQTTIHLSHGRTHSCYLPPSHVIPTETLLENPSQLHNTEYKKKQRKMMLEGERPKECSHCWTIEDLPGENISDRLIRARQNWAKPYIQKVAKLPWITNITPSSVEVSFSNTCNLRCCYCSPHISSAWMDEIKKFGAYTLSENEHQNLDWIKSQGLFPIEEDRNIYLGAFWKWWPELYPKLKIFRITGGEPLLSPHTYKILDWIGNNPHENLELDINTNLSVPLQTINIFLEKISALSQNKKIKKFRLHTSLDAWGARAEYIRSGLRFPYFLQNVHRYLEKIPSGDLFFISTFSALSVGGFHEFLTGISDIRKKFPSRRIGVDSPHLTSPDFLSAQILPESFSKNFKTWFTQMQVQNFPIDEIEKIQRIETWMQQKPSAKELEKLRTDFRYFFAEYDRRRGTSLHINFPELSYI